MRLRSGDIYQQRWPGTFLHASGCCPSLWPHAWMTGTPPWTWARNKAVNKIQIIFLWCRIDRVSSILRVRIPRRRVFSALRCCCRRRCLCLSCQSCLLPEKKDKYKIFFKSNIHHPPPWYFEAGEVERLLELREVDETRLVLVNYAELVLQLGLLIVCQRLQSHREFIRGALQRVQLESVCGEVICWLCQRNRNQRRDWMGWGARTEAPTTPDPLHTLGTWDSRSYWGRQTHGSREVYPSPPLLGVWRVNVGMRRDYFIIRGRDRKRITIGDIGHRVMIVMWSDHAMLSWNVLSLAGPGSWQY